MGFDHYSHRFRSFVGDGSNSGLTPSGLNGLTPGLPNNHWFSYNVGLVHYVMMSTEAYFFYNGAATQFKWLEADLSAVDRKVTPWVVVSGHRSIYCSCDGDCDSAATTVREGQYGMEELFMKYGVDLWRACRAARGRGAPPVRRAHPQPPARRPPRRPPVRAVNGHEHDYERNYPTYKHAVATAPSGGAPGGNAARPELIVNPAAPVYIVTGCAGDVENHEPFTRAQPAYSAFR